MLVQPEQSAAQVADESKTFDSGANSACRPNVFSNTTEELYGAVPNLSSKVFFISPASTKLSALTIEAGAVAVKVVVPVQVPKLVAWSFQGKQPYTA